MIGKMDVTAKSLIDLHEEWYCTTSTFTTFINSSEFLILPWQVQVLRERASITTQVLFAVSIPSSNHRLHCPITLWAISMFLCLCTSHTTSYPTLLTSNAKSALILSINRIQSPANLIHHCRDFTTEDTPQLRTKLPGWLFLTRRSVPHFTDCELHVFDQILSRIVFADTDK